MCEKARTWQENGRNTRRSYNEIINSQESGESSKTFERETKSTMRSGLDKALRVIKMNELKLII